MIDIIPGLKGLKGGRTMRHTQLAQKVLKRLEINLQLQGLLVTRCGWPYNVVAEGFGRKISLFCSGFTKRIDIQPLRKNGKPDVRYKECSYLTPVGASNHIRKFFEGLKHG